jgi:two-component system, cell cycle sensor histidine kinase and response regulator CckA
MTTLQSEVIPRGVETILLVDADPEPRKLAAFMLTKQGYTVIEARNGDDALRVFDSRGAEVDLLLTEILMPKVTGPDLAARLLALQPRMRVLYMSHANHQRIARHLQIDPERGFLPKPFTMRVLAGKVREVLDAPRAKALALAVHD